MAPVFTKSDPLIEVGADRSFPLDTGDVWFVENGRVDIFCIRRDADGSVVERAHVARVGAGSCIVGSRSEDAGRGPAAGPAVGASTARDDGAVAVTTETDDGSLVSRPAVGEAGILQAVGSAGTTLRRLSRSVAADRFCDASRRAECASLIDEWVVALWAELTPAGLPRDCRSLRQGSIARLEPQAGASSGAGVSWIVHRKGRSRLLGRPELPLPAGPFPCSPRVWFQSEAAGAVQVVGTQAVIEKGEVWAGLAELQRLAVQCALLLMAERAAKERRRQQGRDAERRALLSDAFTELLTAHDAVSDAPPPASASDRDGMAPEQMLPAACRLVGNALGISLEPGRTRDTAGHVDPVAAIARASAVRARRVLLGGLWWRRDNGPLLGRTAGGDKRWVALLPASAGTLRALRPARRRPEDR